MAPFIPKKMTNEESKAYAALVVGQRLMELGSATFLIGEARLAKLKRDSR